MSVYLSYVMSNSVGTTSILEFRTGRKGRNRRPQPNNKPDGSMVEDDVSYVFPITALEKPRRVTERLVFQYREGRKVCVRNEKFFLFRLWKSRAVQERDRLKAPGLCDVAALRH